MKRHESLPGFLAIYLGYILFIFFINKLLFTTFFSVSTSGILSFSVGQASLTTFTSTALNSSIVGIYHIFYIVITHAAGLLFLTYSLWFYWKLIQKTENQRGLNAAFGLTLKTSLLVESFLFVFFLYAIPNELANGGFPNKLISALSLAVGSFNNAGFLLAEPMLLPDAIQNSYVIQIGIIIGSTVGHFGIFVIDELLSPRNLRIRIHRPDIDWSLITKTAVFGTAIILVIFSGIFYFVESDLVLKDKNIVESVIASAFEITSYRGFGETLFNSEYPIIKTITSAFFSGPFSTGGGLTLIFFLWIYYLLSNGKANQRLNRLSPIGKHLFTYSFISFGIFTLITIVAYGNLQIQYKLNDAWSVFSTNSSNISIGASWSSDM